MIETGKKCEKMTDIHKECVIVFKEIILIWIKIADATWQNSNKRQVFVNNVLLFSKKFWNINFLTTGCESPGAD